MGLIHAGQLVLVLESWCEAPSWPKEGIQEADGRLGQALQFFAGLESDGLAGRDIDFSAGAGVPPDAGLAGLYVENTEAAQLDSVALFQGLLHGVEDGLDRHLRLGLGDPGPVHHFVYDIELNHRNSPVRPNRFLGLSAGRAKTPLA